MKPNPKRALRFALALAALALNVLGRQPANAATFTTTGALSGSRAGHSTTLLRNGTLLVVGGFNGTVRLTSSELYNPATGGWAASGALTTGRTTHTATLMSNGKVLAAIGSMFFARQAHTATLLTDGRVLVAGGGNVGYFTSGAEIYDPASGTWGTTGALGTARGVHTATLLPDGRVLAAGGNHNNINEPLTALSSAELYDPATGTWTASGSLNAARSTHTATLLPGGQVVIAAGYYVDSLVQLSSVELYDSAVRPITLVNLEKQPGSALQFAFTAAPNGTNSVLATTDLSLPLADWTALGVVPEFSDGLFVFRDPQAATGSRRFYQIRSP